MVPCFIKSRFWAREAPLNCYAGAESTRSKRRKILIAQASPVMGYFWTIGVDKTFICMSLVHIRLERYEWMIGPGETVSFS
ncbi:hypothetical protein CEXT_231201 [Caerostris extrusa]|uniref:Uncharacterized protein n=1 Tax=Caerostris extrusa TaxID=172846 RepID=A0AAV4RG19_CAEEX|nr:hypothetical protein CEXT_231201 [Caerostris extrusa]